VISHIVDETMHEVEFKTDNKNLWMGEVVVEANRVGEGRCGIDARNFDNVTTMCGDICEEVTVVVVARIRNALPDQCFESFKHMSDEKCLTTVHHLRGCGCPSRGRRVRRSD